MKIFLLLGLLIPSSVLAYTSPKTCVELENRFLKKVPRKNSSQNEHRFRQWIEGAWDYTMQEFPEYATYVGYPGQNDRWSELSSAARDRRRLLTKCLLTFGKSVNRHQLNPQNQLSYDLFLQKLELEDQGAKFDDDLVMITQLDGVHLWLPDLIFAAPKQNLKDYQDLQKRLESVPTLIAQTQDMLKLGIAKNFTHVKFLMQKVPAQIDEITVSDYAKNPLYREFKELPNFLTENQKIEIQARAKEAIATKIIPAFKNLKKFIETEYIPKCRDSIAAYQLPQGPVYYAHRSRVQTTTNWEPQKIHDLGLREVERISKLMEQLRNEIKFQGDQTAFNKFLNTDSQFVYKNPEDLITGYREIAKRIDPELPKLFKTLPRLTYGVKAMPDYKGATGPTAYYQPGSPTAGRAGYFEANTYDLKSRPKWEMEALTMHEAVPGHHLQISIAQELSDMPEFRKNEGYTAFIEGWGLYAESLGYDIGMYKDPYQRYGQLVYDMWRACRLVVDTGIHALGWDRARAVNFMAERTGKARLDIENEIDRYITWPGQALAYKVGQLKFMELKELTKQRLGDKYDIREFHDEVLRHGAIPLSVLERLHGEWLAKKLKSSK